MESTDQPCSRRLAHPSGQHHRNRTRRASSYRATHLRRTFAMTRPPTYQADLTRRLGPPRTADRYVTRRVVIGQSGRVTDCDPFVGVDVSSAVGDDEGSRQLLTALSSFVAELASRCSSRWYVTARRPEFS